MDAETIADALDLKKTGTGWRGPCPVCGGSDMATKFTVRDEGSQVLVHCFAGCTQDAVIAELRHRGLWPDTTPQQKRTRTKRMRTRDRERAELSLFVYQENIARGYQMNEAEISKYLDLKRRAGP